MGGGVVPTLPPPRFRFLRGLNCDTHRKLGTGAATQHWSNSPVFPKKFIFTLSRQKLFYLEY